MCEWLDGLGSAAQARSDGFEDATPHARRALDARPAGHAGARAQLEVGLALARAGSPSESASALAAALPASTATTRSAILAALGEALLSSGKPREAWQTFRDSSAEGSGAVAQRSRRRAAAALHAGGFSAESVAAWRPLVSDRLATGLDPSDRLGFALDLRAAGDPHRAAEILRAIWTELPDRPEAAEAEAALTGWKGQGGAPPPFSGEERVERALRLIAIGRAAEGRDELVRAGEGRSPAPSELIVLADATALLSLGRPGEAAGAVEPLTRSTGAGIRRGAAIVRARAAARERRIPDAIAAWRAVAASSAIVPGLQASAQASLTDDAAYFAAWLSLDAGDLDRAASELSRLAREHPGSRRAEDARWFAAWALVRKGAAAEADAALRRAEEGGAVPRVRYWRAMIAADPAVAKSLLESVASADPLGYYGLLACARLRARSEPCPPAPLGPGRALPELSGLTDAPQLQQASRLASLGLRDDALAELAALHGQNGGRRAAPHAAELAHFLGDPLLPFRVARDQLGLSRRTLAWSFPEAWPRLVGGAARATGVDPTLLTAVMRRESGFRSDARSPAGAVGLLQIVPATAARLATLLRLPSPIAERMEEPGVNVPLGAGYLALLQERFGEPLMAVAAYNAGPNAVLRWSRDRPPLPLDAWVESIPFRETRQYVRAVVENWAGARAAAGLPPPEIDPDRLMRAAGTGVAF